MSGQRSRSMAHLRAGELQAFRDGEGSRWWRVRARMHLWRCASCRAARERVEAECARASALLAMEVAAPDTDEAWARFAEVTRYQPRRAVAPRVIVLVAAAALVVVVTQSLGGDLVRRMYHLSTDSALGPKRASATDREFAQSLAMLERRGALHRVSDVCCSDRDGEGPADDGVLTVRLDGSRSPVVILYEDTKHAGRFEPGDVILKLSRPEPPRPEPPAHGS
jgi:hypothetical protein